MDSREEIEAHAADWLARREGESWTSDDEAQFEAWRSASTANRIAVLRVEAAWEQMNRLQAIGAGVPPRTVPTPEQLSTSPFVLGNEEGRTRLRAPIPRERKRFAALAASVVLALLAGMFAYNGLIGGSHYSTEIGGVETVALKDGSKVILNTDSEIRVSLTETQRRIQLDQGEAFFDVAKDPSRPFVVHAGDKRITAIGTKFSVRRDGKDVQVVVMEGRVDLAEDEIASPLQGAPSANSTLLAAGAIARASRSEVLVRTEATSEAENLLSWRRGYVSFQNTPLAEAVAEFNRYNERKIVIGDPDIADMRLSGKFRSSNFETFVRLLEQSFPVRVQHEGDEIVLGSATTKGNP